ncbi:uncharacterized protein LOC125210014 [Salvia hispanica]|uniref:uncharacterized protein LOC125210014 n=1 Tax=Salvia hispanica TaxID=49212 RepID=UPI0020099656|nr:uncharacterized protein LOC125210014 [Salvia hispanica]
MQENRVPKLVHFPVPDEYTSILRHIAKCTTSPSDDIVQHQHPLTLHHDYPVYNDDEEINNDGDVHRLPKCNGCIQFISPPFYTCSRCPKLLLNDCCVRLPRKRALRPLKGSLEIGWLSRSTGKLIGLNSRDESSHGISKTLCCNRLTNGFTYSHREMNRDIICSFMPDAITHTSHAKTHVLRSYVHPLEYEVATCRCCNGFLRDISYNCTTCRNFSIHATCACLPATVHHVSDLHPLELVTAPPPHMQSQTETFCDACEQGLDCTQWYYGCADCEQAFHVDCLDQLSFIKYEIAEVHEAYHKCPLTLGPRP